MAKLLFLLTFLVFSSDIVAQDKEIGEFKFTEKNRNHSVTLVVRTKAFIKSRHNLVHIPERAGAKALKIDGRPAHGTDGDLPRIEIDSMVISFDGKKLVVPRSLYSDCYSPNLGKDAFATKLGEGGDSLLIFMVGSDAAGGYQIMWVLRKDGHHSRFINDCSDCPFSDMFYFFMKQ